MFITEQYVQNFSCIWIFLLAVTVTLALNNMILVFIEFLKLRMKSLIYYLRISPVLITV